MSDAADHPPAASLAEAWDAYERAYLADQFDPAMRRWHRLAFAWAAWSTVSALKNPAAAVDYTAEMARFFGAQAPNLAPMPEPDQEPPDPVPTLYAQALIDRVGGPSEASRITHVRRRTLARVYEGGEADAMPWSVAKLLWLSLFSRRN